MTVGNNTQRGVTLVELLVVLAIIAILAMVAAPSLIGQIKQDRVNTTANQLSSFYRFARSEAVKREVPVKLALENNDWVMKVVEQGQEVTLRRFTVDPNQVAVNLVDRTLRSSGELSAFSNILISDNDATTDDVRLCILHSGQSWLSKATDNCA
ncbi:GspH/FimT family pseudopilin [Pseudoalteromonas sp. OOF1S-7]|uniref:pilus assembly FimT family protein n=1 Tax=Pseudoalteromonas sp. OOF1S-7 TaxID=2917757 RepID=UPI001EF4F7DA|nr:GspH/FimT family pseudopilin [Pseudoalteromonas sp. OOF1S-7]MCG7536731.1 GspH/FimT family pseudopilin [Pseudoalteromonas sp. OOF1S-7]